MKTILVTGGAGFIGSNFLHYMVQQSSYHLVNLDALTYAGHTANVADLAGLPNYTFVHGSILDKTLLDRLFDQYDFHMVVNFAAETHVDTSIIHPKLFLETNGLGTQQLLDCTKAHWSTASPHRRNFLQVSTAEVYGTQGEGHESCPLAPNNPYAASKASGDLLVRAYHETYGLPVTITRCGNCYGPYQYSEKLIPEMIHRAKNNQSLPIYGDGLQIRDWIHVFDHCRAIALVLEQGTIGEVYNIGCGNQKTKLDVIKMILATMKKPEHLIQFLPDRRGHDRRYMVDSSKLTNQLQWIPQYDLETGLKETIFWYIDHLSWMDSYT